MSAVFDAADERPRCSGRPKASRLKVDLWHLVLWSRYKGDVFSKLHELARNRGIDARFVQIAEGDGNRLALAPIDLDWHRYPFYLLFRGSLACVPKWRLFRAVGSRTWRSDADIVVLAGYERPEYWLQLIILRIRGKKVAVFSESTIHDRVQHPIKSILKRTFFRACHGFFCYGLRSGEYVRHYGAEPQRIFARCQAAALFGRYDATDVLRRRVNARRLNDVRFLYVGRLETEKSIGDLVRAFARVLTLQPDAQLVLVGTGCEQEALVQLAAAVGRSRVIFAGARHGEALIVEYLRASCLILPSRSEPWGLVVNEALSCGCPVLVSDRCGCAPELVVDGVTGISFPCGEVETLAAKLASVPQVFADTRMVATACIARVAPYTAAAAAENILNGCEAISNMAM